MVLLPDMTKNQQDSVRQLLTGILRQCPNAQISFSLSEEDLLPDEEIRTWQDKKTNLIHIGIFTKEWHDPTHGKIDRDIQETVDKMFPISLAQRIAMENTLQDKRDAERKSASTV